MSNTTQSGAGVPSSADPAVERLAREVAELRAENRAHHLERAALRADLDAVRAQVLRDGAGSESERAAEPPNQPGRRRRGRRPSSRASGQEGSEAVVSRRRLFGLLGGAAAVGTGLAVGGAALTAEPAGATVVTTGAADGDAVQIGGANTNTAGSSASTSLTGSTSTLSAAPLFQVTQSGSGISSQAFGASHSGNARATVGVAGQATGTGNGTAGVTGQSTGSGTGNFGVKGFCFTGTGVQGSGGVGVEAASSSGAALLVVDNGVTMPPTTGAWTTGSFVVSGGQLWFCTAGGTAPTVTFVNLTLGSKLVSIAPARVYDSRPSQLPSTGPKTPIANNATVTVDVTNNASGVPTTATAVLGNLTVTNTTGPGFLTVFDHGSARPATSNINYSLGQNLANSFTSSCSGTNKLDVFNGGPATDFIVDIVGYYP